MLWPFAQGAQYRTATLTAFSPQRGPSLADEVCRLEACLAPELRPNRRTGWCWWKGLAAPEEAQGAPGAQRFPFWNHPRERVSWCEAVAFCRWLSSRAEEMRDQLPPALRGVSSWRISLPTEWQWEKAARGHDGRRYPWSTEYRSGYANIDETYVMAGSKPVGEHYLRKTSAVGMYPQGASPYGICDLCGNIWEWCLNEYVNLERIQEAGAERRVLRGGSWINAFGLAAAAVRNGSSPSYRVNYWGFRVVVCAVPVV